MVVKTIDAGEDFIIKALPGDTVLDVKMAIHIQKGYILLQQELAAGVGGKVLVLEDDNTLRYYSIRSRSTVYLYFRPGSVSTERG